MPFNEKGEIIRPDKREKTRSDIQRSVSSNDDDTSVADIQRSTPSNDDDAKDIFRSFGLLIIILGVIWVVIVLIDKFV